MKTSLNVASLQSTQDYTTAYHSYQTTEIYIISTVNTPSTGYQSNVSQSALVKFDEFLKGEITESGFLNNYGYVRNSAVALFKGIPTRTYTKSTPILLLWNQINLSKKASGVLAELDSRILTRSEFMVLSKTL